MINRASGVPVYRQVADDLRKKIRDGEFEPGSKLPSERQLVQEYAASRLTIRDALDVLRSEGLINSEHGKGVFVRSTHQIRRLSSKRLSRRARNANRGAFLADAEKSAFTPSVDVEITFEPLNTEFATIFDLPEGRESLVRRRVMSADGIAVQLSVSRMPRSLTRDTAIEQENTGPGGAYARLEEQGHTLGHFSEAVKTRMPTPDELLLLQLSAGTPILSVRRIAFDTNGKAVEVNDMQLAGDKYELEYEIPAD